MHRMTLKRILIAALFAIVLALPRVCAAESDPIENSASAASDEAAPPSLPPADDEPPFSPPDDGFGPPPAPLFEKRASRDDEKKPDEKEPVWAKDSRPFKRRAELKKEAEVQEILSSPEQMRRRLGSPHEMPDLPVSAAMPADFTTAEPIPETQAKRPQKRRLPPLAKSPVKRGGAGGNVRRVEYEEPPRTALTQDNAADSDGALKMFDDKTAKDVMNISPDAEELKKLSPAERQKLLDDVRVNQKGTDENASSSFRSRRSKSRAK